jgi:dihydropteroate synthase
MILRLRDSELDLARPVLMGIVNATPDSFSDRQGAKDASELAELGLRLLEEGAAIVDVGGESGRTDTEAVPVDVEIERIVPVVERLVAGGASVAPSPLVSVDTWRGPVARAALDAGAAMINDVSGLSDESVAAACAETGAALVITHTRAPPKTKAFPHYDDVVTDVCEFLDARMAAARSAGLDDERIVLDPGIDISKTPAESIELIRRLPELARLGRPLLLAVSRKDFVGALTERPPAERDAGTLAAVAAAVDGGAKIIRVHDVAGARDYLRVHDALANGADGRLTLAPDLRREAM